MTYWAKTDKTLKKNKKIKKYSFIFARSCLGIGLSRLGDFDQGQSRLGQQNNDTIITDKIQLLPCFAVLV